MPMRIFGVVSILLNLVFSVNAGADQSNIAVAANFTAPAREIAAAFKVSTGYEAILSFGSTGKLYAQIVNAAPFSVFLAADSQRPRLLEENGLSVPESRFTYARGKIVIYTPLTDLFGEMPLNSLRNDIVQRLAIANPKTAPYGKAAVETLRKHGLWNSVRKKIVQGDNIAQTYQFVATRNAQVGFIALSQALKAQTGSKWIVPEENYTPIKQQAVLLQRGAADKVAVEFIRFLKGPKARSIIHSYGYGSD